MTHADLEFLAHYDASRFPAFAVTVDLALLTVRDGALWARLVQRTAPPQEGRWALPGGFVGPDESLDDAARRVLHDKAGVHDVYLEQLYTFGRPDRDPRTRVVSVAYAALTWSSEEDGWMRLAVPWPGETGGAVEVPDAGPLAFDHDEILGVAVLRLRGKLDYTNVGFSLLPPAFTLHQLQKLHEVVLGRALNKDSFRRRLLGSGLLEATGDKQTQVGHRPAALYRFSGATAPDQGRR